MDPIAQSVYGASHPKCDLSYMLLVLQLCNAFIPDPELHGRSATCKL